MNNSMIGISFNEFIGKHDNNFKPNIGLDDVFNKIKIATKEISYQVNKAGIMDILGKADKDNIQGEEVMKLDEIANELLIYHLNSSEYCAGVASEEMDTFIQFENKNENASFVVLFDPLDGSSNIDTNASIGTIFNIYKRKSKGDLILNDFIQSGQEVVAAGYVIYGSSTLLVYSAGHGVHGFTLEQKSNEFLLSHPNIKTPNTANQFSINYGNYKTFDKKVTNFVAWCTDIDVETKRPYSLRYIGSMVADFHRNLVKGGIFIYPATEKTPQGKLRLLYECIPLSFIQEQAGGKSTDNSQSILSIIPEELHQRTPITIGSSFLVDTYLNS